LSYNRAVFAIRGSFKLIVSESFAPVRPGFFPDSRRRREIRFPAFSLLVFFTLTISIGFPSALAAQTTSPEGELKVFDVSTAPDFQDYKRVLTNYARKHNPKSGNDFCVVGYLTSDDLKSAWVIWQQKRKIILWEGQNDLDLSRRRLDLKSDVVPTENDLHGSTYLVTKAWVKKITDACERSGTQVHVPRK
jgi:hypothetical protein